jgi:hypothetical protein
MKPDIQALINKAKDSLEAAKALVLFKSLAKTHILSERHSVRKPDSKI